MLDTLADKEPELSPRSDAQPGGTDGPALHPSREDLKGYAYGRLASARLDYCQAHLDTCEDCRTELEDIRTCSNEMPSLARPEVPRATSLRRNRGPLLPLAASAAVLVAVAVATSLWVRHGDAPPPTKQGAVARMAAALSRVAHNPFAPAKVAPTPPARAPAALVATAAAPAANTSPGNTRSANTPLADAIAALPDDVRSAVSATLQHGKLQFPTDVGRARRHAAPRTDGSAANTSFALLGPFGEATSETRPEFTWQPLAGAKHYSVAIVDAALHPVQRSPALHKTTWRPRRPLRPGRTYLWQVTATLHGGSKVVASEPAPSEAVLRIVPVKLTDEMARFRKDHPDSHLVLGALYAQAGMLSESEAELKKVPPGDPTYKTARALLESLASGSAVAAP